MKKYTLTAGRASAAAAFVLTAVLVPAAVLFAGMLCRDDSELSSEDFIRLHVVAQSNSEEDQQLKLQVRDSVIEYINSEIMNASASDASNAAVSMEDAQSFITENLDEIENAAQQTVNDAGLNCTVKAEYGETWIPEKQYGNIIFPSGSYMALRILIGEAKGKNWWCVLYPPLCLIDSQERPEEEQELMRDVLLPEKYSELRGYTSEKRPVKMLHLRFKSAELLKNYHHKKISDEII